MLPLIKIGMIYIVINFGTYIFSFLQWDKNGHDFSFTLFAW